MYRTVSAAIEHKKGFFTEEDVNFTCKTLIDNGFDASIVFALTDAEISRFQLKAGLIRHVKIYLSEIEAQEAVSKPLHLSLNIHYSIAQARKKRRRIHTPETLSDALKASEPNLLQNLFPREGDWKFMEYEDKNGNILNCFICRICITSLEIPGGDLSPIRVHCYGRPHKGAVPTHQKYVAQRIAGTRNTRYLKLLILSLYFILTLDLKCFNKASVGCDCKSDKEATLPTLLLL